jgi:4-hydroxy-2-oxoheptanedioate aldolase
MHTNRLKQKLAAGGAATVIAPFATSAGLVELLGHLGFDGVFLDCEHGPSDWESLEHQIRAAELAGYSAVVRVASNDGPTITRALDRGAAGVQVPHVNTRSDAEAAVRHAKFAPLGERGWSGWRTVFGERDMAEYARRANAETLVAVMLEEVAALANLDELLRVEHVDVFFVAPGDLAQSMGYPGETEHPRVAAAVDDAIRRIHAAGRTPGTVTTPESLDHHLELGARFLFVGLASLLAPASAALIQRTAAIETG